ncbi:unnamed protein product [Peronospora belbahrii]|uniref:Uncharacterized protein n=1 Tax=Peronospora belbahrii TaxID=622444 RepID=A0ABN8D6G0_9STRA|nr:unnamed protein product [Peronospora belbahrii]
MWIRSTHGTRGALKRKQATATQEESSASDNVMNAAFEQGPNIFSEAMRSDKRDVWTKEMEEEIAALHDNIV